MPQAGRILNTFEIGSIINLKIIFQHINCSFSLVLIVFRIIPFYNQAEAAAHWPFIDAATTWSTEILQTSFTCIVIVIHIHV